MWIISMGNHGTAEGISERRRSSCSSFLKCFVEVEMRGAGQSRWTALSNNYGRMMEHQRTWIAATNLWVLRWINEWIIRYLAVYTQCETKSLSWGKKKHADVCHVDLLGHKISIQIGKRVMLGLHRIATSLGLIYELKIWISWTREQSLNFYRQIASVYIDLNTDTSWKKRGFIAFI